MAQEGLKGQLESIVSVASTVFIDDSFMGPVPEGGSPGFGLLL
jgi:hypothetical protein